MVSCCYVIVSLTLRGPDEYGSESFQYEDKTAWTVPLQRVAGMGNEREQELGQFGSVTGPTKALEMLNDGSSFESACKAGPQTAENLTFLLQESPSLLAQVFP